MNSGILMTLTASVEAPIIHFLTLHTKLIFISLLAEKYDYSCFCQRDFHLCPLGKTVWPAVLRTYRGLGRQLCPWVNVGFLPFCPPREAEHQLVSWPFIPKEDFPVLREYRIGLKLWRISNKYTSKPGFLFGGESGMERKAAGWMPKEYQSEVIVFSLYSHCCCPLHNHV